MDGRAFDVARLGLRVGTDQLVEIMGLELVGVAGQRFEVADAVIACAGLEDVAKGKGAQGGVTAGAAAAYGKALGIDFAQACQVACRIDCIVYVGHAPCAVQALPIGAAEAAAAAVVDVDHGEAEAGPVLDGQVQGRRGHRSRAAMSQNEERWQAACLSGEMRIAGAIEKRMGCEAAFGGEFQRLGQR